MSHTCTRLRDIVLSTPLLWTDINFVGGKTHPGAYDEIAARLERSSSVPIDVAATNIATKEDAEIFLRLVYPHVKRWRSFDLSVLDAHVAVSLMENLLDEAPILERMNLSGPGVRIFNPFGGRAPNLRHLSTRSMPLKWDGPLFDNLHTLSIHTPTWTQASLLGKCELDPGFIRSIGFIFPVLVRLSFAGRRAIRPGLIALPKKASARRHGARANWQTRGFFSTQRAKSNMLTHLIPSSCRA